MRYLIVLLLIFSQGLYAQSGVKKVSASAGSFTGIQAAVKIAAIKVRVTTSDSLTLGYMPAKEGNETYQLVPDGQESRWLDSLVGKRYGSQFARGGKELLWLVNLLTFSTDTTGQYYFGRIQAEIHVKKADGTYDYVTSVDTTFNSQLAGEEGLGSGIVAMLDGIYQTGISADYQTRPTAQKKVLSALKSEVSRGVYSDYQALRSNKPSFTGSFWVEADTTLSCGHVKLFTMSEDSTVQQLTDVWGVSFGGNELYKYEGGVLLPIEKSGDGFVLSRYIAPSERRNQALLWRRVASNGWPADTNPFGRNRTLMVKTKPGQQAAAVATRIDPNSGELAF